MDLTLDDLNDICWALKDLNFRLGRSKSGAKQRKFNEEIDRYTKIEKKLWTVTSQLELLRTERAFAQIAIRLQQPEVFK